MLQRVYATKPVRGQVADKPVERARMLFSGRVEFVVGEFRLFGRGGDRGAGHAQRTAHVVCGTWHRVDKTDADNPAESQVLIPARERDEIDWDMANRLATENRDFLEYVKLVKQFYQTGEARLADWDVPETTE